MYLPDYVQSEHECGCIVACLAMVCGQTFSETLEGLLPFWQEEGQFDGIKDEIFDAYLSQRGYAIQYMAHDYDPMILLRRQWPPKPFAPIHVADVFDEGCHGVVMLADGAIMDPNDLSRRRLEDYHRVFAVAGIWKVGTWLPKP